MTVKLDLLRDWRLMAKGEALLLAADREDPRKVIIDLNCEERTWLYCDHADAEKPQFLAVAGPGLETVEFWVAGDTAVSFVPDAPKDADVQVWVYTAEIEPNVGEVPDAVSFTEIVERRARNPELEMMQLIARQNEARLNAQMDQMRALVERNERAAANVGAVESNGGAGSASDGANGAAATASGEKPAGGGEPAGGAGVHDDAS